MQSSLNLDNLLSCQRDVFDKSGLGYQKNTNEILNKYPFASEKQKQKNALYTNRLNTQQVTILMA